MLKLHTIIAQLDAKRKFTFIFFLAASTLLTPVANAQGNKTDATISIAHLIVQQLENPTLSGELITYTKKGESVGDWTAARKLARSHIPELLNMLQKGQNTMFAPMLQANKVQLVDSKTIHDKNPFSNAGLLQIQPAKYSLDCAPRLKKCAIKVWFDTKLFNRSSNISNVMKALYAKDAQTLKKEVPAWSSQLTIELPPGDKPEEEYIFGFYQELSQHLEEKKLLH